MKPWNCLMQVHAQDGMMEGRVTVRSEDQERAVKLANITYVNSLRRLGVWKRIEIREDGTTLYHALSADDVQFVKFLEYGERDLTYPPHEIAQSSALSILESASRRNGTKSEKPPKTQASKPTAAKVLKPKDTSWQQSYIAYFSSPKTLKQAVTDLNGVYQVIRGRVMKLAEDGFGEEKFTLKTGTGEEGLKTVQLVKLSVGIKDAVDEPACA